MSFMQSEFAGRTLGLWLESLAFIVGGFAAGVFISRVGARILKSLSSRTKSRIDDLILAVVEKPLVFILAIVGLRLGLGHFGLPAAASLWVDKAYYLLVAIAVAWVLSRIVDSVIEEYIAPLVERTEGDLDDQLLPIVRRIVNAVIWALALLIGLKNAGYDVGALIAGLGIGGVAVALAAKDTLSNFFGSIAVFVDKPFKMGDRIKVNGVDGTVVDIGIRTSRIRTLDDRVVTMPNSSFAASPIENVSSEPSTKVVETLDWSYANPPEAIERALAALRAIAVDGIVVAPIAAVTGFSEASIRVSFIFYLKKEADYFGTMDAVNGAALRALAAVGLEFAAARRVVLAEGRSAGSKRARP